MRNFFLRIDRVLWQSSFKPELLEHLEDAPDTEECLIRLVTGYIIHRYGISKDLSVSTPKPVMAPEICARKVLLDEGIDYVDIPVFTRTLENVYRSVYPNLVELGTPELINEFAPHCTHGDLIGFVGKQYFI